MLNKLCTATTVAIVSLWIGTSAFAQISNPKHVYDTVKATTITDLFAEVGVATTVSQMEDGTMLIMANIAQGKVLILGLEACGSAQGSGCKEMAMVTVNPFVGLPYKTVLENLVLMNLVNKDFEYGQYFFDHEDKIPMAARFEVFEYGISKGNLLWVIGSMINFSDAYFKLLTEIKTEVDAGQTSGFEAPPVDNETRLSELYSSFKQGQASATGLSAVFASRPFRSLLKSKSFVEDVSWTVSPDEPSPNLFLQRAKD